jgi:hypothetical protein
MARASTVASASRFAMVIILVTTCALTVTGALSGRAVVVAQSAAASGRSTRGNESRYDASRAGDVVTLSDRQAALVVRVLTTASNAYQLTVNDQDVIRRTWHTLDASDRGWV